MTPSNPQRDESTTAHLDSTAHLMNRIGSQLASQLSLVSLDGTRRPKPPALVVVAHGSRDPRALSTVRTLLDRVRALRPGLPVHLGHIELNEPALPDTLAALGTARAVLVPLLLSRGYHVKRDIPEMAAEAQARTRVAPPLGPHPLLVDALQARLVEAGRRMRMDAATRRTSAVILAAAGSRDPDSQTDTNSTAALLSARLGVPVLPAYASTAAPTIPEALAILATQGRHRVAIASYFTAPGRFARECAEKAPWIASAPLGTHPAMASLILNRYDQTLSTDVTMADPRGAGLCPYAAPPRGATSHNQPALAI
ncbi:sirohydrochlorin chelatase [Streptomyces pseudovenezuelae]|uniref:Sirohydrochlorin ferrochelatase n=1 Tax=Streptomyces pseudovenezuelae TaxID=67350 RepID=A0ABT6LGU7_9ACTN|nr:sirohydrochlorin chelatase [Streptomyces pseudovenezuelae]MDH6215521.1 sirohydrochlorin ferrochelatase [Streptomyces pseudovenezuelae]